MIDKVAQRAENIRQLQAKNAEGSRARALGGLGLGVVSGEEDDSTEEEGSEYDNASSDVDSEDSEVVRRYFCSIVTS
ncbi:MAG: hypothetical protein V3W44_00740 [Dehalococcoidales bacterium]